MQDSKGGTPKERPRYAKLASGRDKNPVGWGTTKKQIAPACASASKGHPEKRSLICTSGDTKCKRPCDERKYLVRTIAQPLKLGKLSSFSTRGA